MSGIPVKGGKLVWLQPTPPLRKRLADYLSSCTYVAHAMPWLMMPLGVTMDDQRVLDAMQRARKLPAEKPST